MPELITFDIETGAVTSSEFTPTPAPPAPPKTIFSPLEYLERFTEAEQLAVAAAAMSNPAINLWYYKLLGATFVDLDDPRVAAGIDQLIAAGLIDAMRKPTLLAPEERS